MKRRDFLLFSAMGAIGAFAGSRSISSRPVREPNAIYKSRDGLLEINLTAESKPIQWGNQTVYPLTYNGQIPGPRLEAKAGDTVRIHFTNRLDTPTNLHYHGLHIPPSGNGDNPFLHVPPRETFTYQFTIPKNHPSGTFWYHPHHHHHVAEQIFGGLAGLFVIRGELDEIAEIKHATEQFAVLKDFGFDNNGQIRSPYPPDFMTGREGDILTVNGEINPVFRVAKGGLLRLRLLNASASRFYRLALEDHPFYLIATDGGSIDHPIELDEILLTPGERAEVLIRGDREPANYRLLALPYNREGMGMMGGGMMGGGMMGGGMMRGRDEGTRVLATLTYQGSVSPIPLPKQLIPVEILGEPNASRQIEFSSGMGMGMGMGMIFAFNGEVYGEDRIDTRVKLNTVEDWELVNTDAHRMDHPFHLHVNRFQVISRDGNPEPYRAWKDTVLVRSGETVRIRIPFRDFVGKTVYHCHIADHEDLGMMGTIAIVSQ
ncbi:multicopper oxidase family protein [Pannus brasiliensis CCIBt3594]|uniref:Multicopper oxidase family protein n=1 Tax=Pannus brasiliensis CCIBt3594 TaxID=1427578 RepID=A0AAW9QW37_9CHRO